MKRMWSSSSLPTDHRRTAFEGKEVSLYSYAVSNGCVPKSRCYFLKLGDDVVDALKLNAIHHDGELQGVLHGASNQRQEVTLRVWWAGDINDIEQRMRLRVAGLEIPFPVAPLPESNDDDPILPLRKFGDTRWAVDAEAMGKLFYQTFHQIENLQISEAENALSGFLSEHPSNRAALDLLFDCARERQAWDEAFDIADGLPGSPGG